MGSKDGLVSGKGAHPPSLPVSVASMWPSQHSPCLGLPRVYLPVGLIVLRGSSAFSSYTYIHCAHRPHGGQEGSAPVITIPELTL